MERNLDWRVEVGFPIYNERVKRIVLRLMDIQVRDNYKTRILDAIHFGALGYLPTTMAGHLFGYHAAAAMDAHLTRSRTLYRHHR